MDPVTAAKIGSTAIVFGVMVIFGLLPLCIVKWLKDRASQSRAGAVISYLNCFAGGVFLGTAMLHLLSESEEQVREALNKPNSTSIDYPITEVAISGGFFVILLMEVIVLRIMHGVGRGPGGHAHSRRRNSNASDDPRQPLLTSTGKPDVVIEEAEENVARKLSASGVHEEVREIIKETPSVFRPIVLVLALSLHMIFEALAIGLQETESDVWTLLLAVSLHKCIVAFSIGLEMRQVLKSIRSFLGFILLFSIIGSLGIPIGIAVTDTYEEDSLVIGLMQAVATGTFFYVTFFEILQREFSHSHSVTKLFLCALGYIAVALLKLQDED